MSHTTDVIIKSQDTPWLLTPDERAFCRLDGPHGGPEDGPKSATDAEWWAWVLAGGRDGTNDAPLGMED